MKLIIGHEYHPRHLIYLHPYTLIGIFGNKVALEYTDTSSYRSDRKDFVLTVTDFEKNYRFEFNDVMREHLTQRIASMKEFIEKNQRELASLEKQLSELK